MKSKQRDFKIKGIHRKFEPMDDNRAVRKTWKHFLSPEEHWGRLCDCDIRELAGEAESLLGERRIYRERPVLVDAAAQERAASILKGLHDEYYAPLYVSAVEHYVELVQNKQYVTLMDEKGIVVLMKRFYEVYRIKTAFRPTPGNLKVDFKEKDFFTEAHRYLKKKEAKTGKNLAGAVFSGMDTGLIIPETIKDTWKLARAIGWLNALGMDGGLGIGRLAYQIWEVTAGVLKKELISGISWDSMLDEVAELVKEDDDEGLVVMMNTIEDELAVADALGLNMKSERFVSGLLGLLAWYEPASPLLPVLAFNRNTELESSGTALAGMWGKAGNLFLDAMVNSLKETADFEKAVEPIPEPDALGKVVKGILGATAVVVIGRAIKSILSGGKQGTAALLDKLRNSGAIEGLAPGFELGKRVKPAAAAPLWVSRKSPPGIREIDFAHEAGQNWQAFVLSSQDSGRGHIRNLTKVFKNRGRVSLTSGSVLIIFSSDNRFECRDIDSCLELAAKGVCRVFYLSID